MPLILEPTIDTTTIIESGISLYRGFSDSTISFEKLSPLNPIQTNFDFPFEIVDQLFNQQKAQKHILELEKNGHFVCFSLRKEVACYYATGGYKRAGFLTIVKFSIIADRITVGGEGPYIYKCDNGTVWLDLRHLPPTWIYAASRTKVDHELLLVRGIVHISKLIPVTPEECDKSFRPWAQTGERIVIEQ